MILSRSSQYALELVLYLVTHEYDDYIPLSLIAEDLDLSAHFLGKVAQPLIKHGILRSFRGPYGGVTLARDPKDISQYDIIVVIEGKSIFTHCMLRPVTCSDKNACPIHNFDSHLRDTIKQSFKGQTMDRYIDHQQINVDTYREVLESRREEIKNPSGDNRNKQRHGKNSGKCTRN